MPKNFLHGLVVKTLISHHKEQSFILLKTLFGDKRSFRIIVNVTVSGLTKLYTKEQRWDIPRAAEKRRRCILGLMYSANL